MPHSREWLDRLIGSEGLSEQVKEAFKRIDRADFVPDEFKEVAYEDRPVGIPQRQTTSQPSLIARMVDAAEITDADKVLEIGTGYGFQTALMAHLAKEVVSIERHEGLAQTARSNLQRAGFTNTEVVVGDGWLGHPDKAPFDAIVVSAAADRLPDSFEGQLVEGGRVVIPLAGPMGDDVYLMVKDSGRLQTKKLITPARFVPLVEGMPE
jgi:protein-L-isoaspartate(D-aspartate) O-methyltransferase